MTGACYDDQEAEVLWKGESVSRLFPGCVGLDETIVARAEKEFGKKRGKYVTLVKQYGRGRLLNMLVSPFTTRGTRNETEEGIRGRLQSQDRAGSGPFQTVWIGYNLPWTSPGEQEDPKIRLPRSDD